MKLNLHPKEFLAIYNLLNSSNVEGADSVHLQEVRNRMRSYAISALLKKETDPPEDVLLNIWENTQKEKINILEKMNKNLDPRNMFLDDKDEDNEYPRKPPSPFIPRVGKVKTNRTTLLGDDRFRHCTELKVSRSGCTRIPVKNPCE